MKNKYLSILLLVLALALSRINITNVESKIDYDKYPFAVDTSKLPEINIYPGEGINNIREIIIEFITDNEGEITFSTWVDGVDQNLYPRRDYTYDFHVELVPAESYTTFYANQSIDNHREVNVNTKINIGRFLRSFDGSKGGQDLESPLFLFHNKDGKISLMTVPYPGNLPEELYNAKVERIPLE